MPPAGCLHGRGLQCVTGTLFHSELGYSTGTELLLSCSDGHRRFRVSAASLGISSIAQEAREAPPRRSTSSSTLDGHVVAVALPAGGFVAPVLHQHRFAPDHCPACTFGTPLGARRAVVFAGNELSVQERCTKVGGSHELGRGDSTRVRYLS